MADSRYRWDFEEENRAGLACLTRQLSLGDQVTRTFLRANTLSRIGDRGLLTAFLAQSIVEHAHAVACLVTNNYVVSAYVVARASVESIVNYSFLAVCDQEDFDAWVSYSRQKAYKLLDRTEKAGDLSVSLKMQPLPDPDDIPGLREDLQRFTSTKGRAVTRWSRKSLGERVGVARQRIRNFHGEAHQLLLALVSLYDTASETTHGTLYGAGFTYGLFKTSETDGLDRHAGELLVATVISLNAFFRVVVEVLRRPSIRAKSRAYCLEYVLGAVEDADLRRDADALEAFELGHSLYHEGNQKGALKHLRTAIERQPKLSRLYVHRSLILDRLGRTDLALSDLDTALRIREHNSEALRARASILAQKRGDYDNAVLDMSNAIYLKSEHPEYRYRRGLIHALARDYKRAVRDFRAALRLGMDTPDVREALSQVYLKLGNKRQVAYSHGSPLA